MAEANINQKQLADSVGVRPPSVNGWLSEKAKFLRGENLLRAAKVLGVSQLWLAEGKGPMRMDDPTGNVVALRKTPDTVSEGLAISRLENDVHVLNLALGALAAAMADHRPTEARDVAKALRRNVPAKFRDQGMLAELIAVLDKAAAT